MTKRERPTNKSLQMKKAWKTRRANGKGDFRSLTAKYERLIQLILELWATASECKDCKILICAKHTKEYEIKLENLA